MPRLINADALIQAAEAALEVAQKAGDTREIIKHNMLLCALREADTVDPVHEAGGCRCGECRHKDTAACPAYDAPMGRTSLRIKHCSEGEVREAHK